MWVVGCGIGVKMVYLDVLEGGAGRRGGRVLVGEPEEGTGEGTGALTRAGRRVSCGCGGISREGCFCNFCGCRQRRAWICAMVFALVTEVVGDAGLLAPPGAQRRGVGGLPALLHRARRRRVSDNEG